MNDPIERQEAIERIVRIRPSTPKQSDYSHGVDVGLAMAMVAIKEQPSAEPDVPDTNVGDLISRQAAITAICEDGTWLESQGCTEITLSERKQRDADILSELPSVEPEIIRCKDCDWWERKDDGPYGYCYSCKHGFYSANWEISIYRRYKEDFFCADAERRTS